MYDLREGTATDYDRYSFIQLFGSILIPLGASEFESSSEQTPSSYSDELDGVFETHR